jgi:hypothetical protein
MFFAASSAAKARRKSRGWIPLIVGRCLNCALLKVVVIVERVGVLKPSPVKMVDWSM